MVLTIEQFPCRSDNFGVLIHDPASGLTAAVDAPDEAPITDLLAKRKWKLDHIFTTHHHPDHTEGNLALKSAFRCTITAPEGEAAKIPGVDKTVKGGDRFAFGEYEVRVIDTPGHTLGHISYWIPKAAVAFVGDTLFAMGCGRVVEGTHKMMWQSLERLIALPDETHVYCGHEYTQANARFALTIEPGNADLIARAKEVDRLRAEGKATLPTTIGLEKKTNPFLRVDQPAIRKLLGMENASAAEVFGEIRDRKDRFK